MLVCKLSVWTKCNTPGQFIGIIFIYTLNYIRTNCTAWKNNYKLLLNKTVIILLACGLMSENTKRRRWEIMSYVLSSKIFITSKINIWNVSLFCIKQRYQLNVCVPPKAYIEILTPNVMVSGEGPLGD